MGKRIKKPTLRGVNLGGWLVLERWMTPSLFDGTDAQDEYSFMRTENAKEKITRHRTTFITEEDFAWCAAHGIDAVRIPIGYWALDDQDGYISTVDEIDWAFRMAETYTIQVLLCLHGAPGSQSGRDHSGRIGRVEWYAASNQDATIALLQRLYRRYGNSSSFWALQVINEPSIAGVRLWKLGRFYRRVVRALPEQCPIVIHDGFMPLLFARLFCRPVLTTLDVHLYHMTSWLARLMSGEAFVGRTKTLYGRILGWVARKRPVIVGEWSVVMRAESTRGISKQMAEERMYRYGQEQIDVFERYADAWFYWSYKTDDPGIWNFRSAIDDGYLVLPKR